MKQQDGWWIPDMMSGAHAYLRRAEDLRAQCKWLKERRAAVQAGGHIGISPALLAEQFERVYTFEPEWENFACLAANAARPNVWAARGFLSDSREPRVLRRHSKSTGGHKTGDRVGGDTPSYRIDDLSLEACSAIFLDVEGFEINALAGAAKTLSRFHPLIVAEENKQCREYGRSIGDLSVFLGDSFGYRVADRLGEDLVFV